jgi:hypothetical protein
MADLAPVTVVRQLYKLRKAKNAWELPLFLAWGADYGLFKRMHKKLLDDEAEVTPPDELPTTQKALERWGFPSPAEQAGDVPVGDFPTPRKRPGAPGVG